MNDTQLLKAVQSGCQLSLSKFYDRHAPIVLGVIMQVVNDRMQGEALLQEAFWRVWQQAGQYDSQVCSPRLWVCAIARRLAIQTVGRPSKLPVKRMRTYSEISSRLIAV